VILGPDHPVTGGYPVIGVVIDEDVDKIAQVRPGQAVRLHWARPRALVGAHSAATSWPFS
jgi:allophanate hydrolase subunit 2